MAAAAGNTVKCVLSAIGVTALHPLVQVTGRGWLFSLLAALSGAGGFLAVSVLKMKGMYWREARIWSTNESCSKTHKEGETAGLEDG